MAAVAAAVAVAVAVAGAVAVAVAAAVAVAVAAAVAVAVAGAVAVRVALLDYRVSASLGRAPTSNRTESATRRASWCNMPPVDVVPLLRTPRSTGGLDWLRFTVMPRRQTL